MRVHTGPCGPIFVARGEKSPVEKMKINISDRDFFQGLVQGDCFCEYSGADGCPFRIFLYIIQMNPARPLLGVVVRRVFFCFWQQCCAMHGICLALRCFVTLCLAWRLLGKSLLCLVLLCIALLCFALLCFALLCFAPSPHTWVQNFLSSAQTFLPRTCQDLPRP